MRVEIDQVTDADVADPLSPVTRRERTGLLLSNVILFAAASAGFVPNEFEAFGIRAHDFNPGSFLLLLYLIVAYFTCAFGVYAIADLHAWRMRLRFLRQRRNDFVKQLMERAIDDESKEILAKYNAQLSTEAMNEILASFAAGMRAAVNVDTTPAWRRYSSRYHFRMWFEIGLPYAITLVNIAIALTA